MRDGVVWCGLLVVGGGGGGEGGLRLTSARTVSSWSLVVARIVFTSCRLWLKLELGVWSWLKLELGVWPWLG